MKAKKAILYVSVLVLTTLSVLFVILTEMAPQRVLISSTSVSTLPPRATRIFASPNQILSATRDASADTTLLRYVVKEGDTLDRIADHFYTSAIALAEANKITEDNPIQVGQELKIVVRDNAY